MKSLKAASTVLFVSHVEHKVRILEIIYVFFQLYGIISSIIINNTTESKEALTFLKRV